MRAHHAQCVNLTLFSPPHVDFAATCAWNSLCWPEISDRGGYGYGFMKLRHNLTLVIVPALLVGIPGSTFPGQEPWRVAVQSQTGPVGLTLAGEMKDAISHARWLILRRAAARHDWKTIGLVLRSFTGAELRQIDTFWDRGAVCAYIHFGSKWDGQISCYELRSRSYGSGWRYVGLQRYDKPAVKNSVLEFP